jgi:hypothetical protein
VRQDLLQGRASPAAPAEPCVPPSTRAQPSPARPPCRRRALT